MLLSRERTLIILDWDDTLFPTTWVTSNDINIKNVTSINSKTIIDFFSKIDIELEHLLKTLLNCGHVAIITNAMLNWINISSGILPRTSKLLDSNKKKYRYNISKRFLSR